MPVFSPSRLSFDGTSTPLKTALFLIVCVAWIMPGLVGHEPWKTDEAIAFGLVHEMLRTGDLVIFRLAGEPYFDRAPLYIWVAGVSARLFGSLLSLHDAARLASGIFVAGALAFVSLASRELLGERATRVAVLLLIGCLGLLIRAHEMVTDLAGLMGLALVLYGLALALRMPRMGGVATGLGMGLGFLGDGVSPLALSAALLVALPALHPAWRTRQHAITSAIALACALPLVALWPLLLWSRSPLMYQIWLDGAAATRWSTMSFGAAFSEITYLGKILPWYAWPAWPLAAWAVWRSRRMLPTRKGIALPLVAFVVFLAGLSLFADAREINAMPLLLPLAILGVAELESVPRGGASALDWFGVTTFFLFAAMLWVAWTAMMTGHPAGVLRWIESEVPGYQYRFSFIAFALAMLFTLIWFAVVAASLRSTRRALVNWTAGITMVWVLVMALGISIVDHVRSYRSLSAKLVDAIPNGFRCVAGRNVGEAQRALLDYYIGLQLVRAEDPAASRCRVLLVQAGLQRGADVPAATWREIWRGSRPGDRNEAFVLYQRI